MSILLVSRQDTMRGGENIIITKGIIQSCSRTVSFTTNKFQLIPQIDTYVEYTRTSSLVQIRVSHI